MNLAINGINGKMGRLVYDLAKKKGHDVVCGVDKNPVGNFDCPVYKSLDEIKCNVDVVVDFSSVSALDGLINFAVQNTVPLVVCTTGFTKNEIDKLRSASNDVAVFYTENTSLGVNAVVRLCKIAAKILKGYDIEIIEKHHRYKTDSPSGTASALYRAISGELNSPTTIVNGRKGNSKRATNEIGIHSLRGGGVCGEHEIVFLGDDQTVSINHEALSKEPFAEGALKAAEFIVSKRRGFFGVDDLSCSAH